MKKLTKDQAAHVAQVNPETKLAMTDYLVRRVPVAIFPQKDTGPDVPPIAIAVADNLEFWIDCRPTVRAAKALARRLKLPVQSVQEPLP